MILVQQMKGVLELRLKSEGGCVKTQLRVKWSSPTIQIALNGRLSDHGTPDNHLRSHAWGNLRFCKWWVRRLRLRRRLWRQLWRWLYQVNWLWVWYPGFFHWWTATGPCLIAPHRRTQWCGFIRRRNDYWSRRLGCGALNMGLFCGSLAAGRKWGLSSSGSCHGWLKKMVGGDGRRRLGSEERANERLLCLGFSLAPFRSSNDQF